MKILKDLDELSLMELPLQIIDGVAQISEDDLEVYLIRNNYNIYDINKTLTYDEVVNEDYTPDYTCLTSFMLGFGFETSASYDEDGEIVFCKK